MRLIFDFFNASLKMLHLADVFYFLLPYSKLFQKLMSSWRLKEQNVITYYENKLLNDFFLNNLGVSGAQFI